MSGPSKRTINRRLKELRELVETSDDPIVSRIAYAMEEAIRWATLNTVGWDTPANSARMQAKMLRDELKARNG